MLLSHRIITDRDRNIQDTANCDQFYQNLKILYESNRIITVNEFVYAFSYDLINFSGQIERNQQKVIWAFTDFKTSLKRRFDKLREINDNHSSYPDEHRGYENILRQQWAYIFEPNAYVKPSDLHRQIPTQTKPSEFYKIFKQLPFRFCLRNILLITQMQIVNSGTAETVLLCQAPNATLIIHGQAVRPLECCAWCLSQTIDYLRISAKSFFVKGSSTKTITEISLTFREKCAGMAK